MKNKNLLKRQILFVVFCLLFFIGIILGAVISIKNSEEIMFIEKAIADYNYIKEFLNSFKFTAVVLILGFIPEAYIIIYFLILYKGLALGYIAFSIAETDIVKRLLALLSFIPPELLLTGFIIFCASYFCSSRNISAGSKLYHQEAKRRTAEIAILSVASVLIALFCAFWKILAAQLLTNII